MSDLQKVANRLKNELCPVHHKSPYAISVVEGNLKFETCCDEFGRKMLQKAADLQMDQIDKQIDNIFRGSGNEII